MGISVPSSEHWRRCDLIYNTFHLKCRRDVVCQWNRSGGGYLAEVHYNPRAGCHDHDVIIMFSARFAVE